MRSSLKLSVAIALTLSTTTVLCGGPEAPPPAHDYFQGFFVGINGGARNVIFEDQNSHLEHNEGIGAISPFNGNYGGDATLDRNVFSGTYGVVAGFGFDVENLYMAAQFEGNFRNTSANFTFDHTPLPSNLFFFSYINNINAKLENEYGAIFKLGYITYPTTLIFGELGGAWTKLSFSSNTVSNVKLTGTGEKETLNSSINKTVSGFRAGVGFEKFLSKHISFMLSYLFTKYNSASQTARKNFTISPTANGYIQDSNKVTPWTNQLLIGLNVHFGQNIADDSFMPWTTKVADTFNGFFISAAGGIQQGVFKHNTLSSSVLEPVLFGYESNLSEDNSNVQGLGSVFAGYGHIIRNIFYLGAMFGGSFGEINKTNFLSVFDANATIMRHSVDMKIGQNYAYLFKPGIFIGPGTLFYGLVGQAFSHLTVSSTLSDSTPGIATSTIAISRKKSVSGFRWGLGLEQRLCNHLSLIIRYMRTTYGGFSLNQSGTITVPDISGPVPTTASAPANISVNTSTDTNSLELGLVLHFGGGSNLDEATLPAPKQTKK